MCDTCGCNVTPAADEHAETQAAWIAGDQGLGEEHELCASCGGFTDQLTGLVHRGLTIEQDGGCLYDGNPD